MSQVLEESQQWLQKNMTEEYAESKNVGSDINVTGQSKRKHQITYLAQQVILILLTNEMFYILFKCSKYIFVLNYINFYLYRLKQMN